MDFYFPADLSKAVGYLSQEAARLEIALWCHDEQPSFW